MSKIIFVYKAEFLALKVYIAEMDGIIRGVSLGGLKVFINRLKALYPGIKPLVKSSGEPPIFISVFLKNYGSGVPSGKINYDPSILTPFQKKVFRSLARVRAGSTISYAVLAREAGTASPRAVGTALRSNPYPLLIPCHRVIKSDGTPGGFAGSSLRMRSVKIKLLRYEESAAKCGRASTSR